MLPAEIKSSLLAMLGDDDVRSMLRGIFGVEEREREVRELREEVAAHQVASRELKEEIAAQKTVIRQQEERLSDLEQYSRRNCLNFVGVPEAKEENAVQLALDLAKMANVKLDRADIDRAHRIGAPKPATSDQPQPPPRPLVVKYVSYLKREAVWFGRREVRKAKPPRTSSLTEDMTKDIFIQENLTRRNQEIMFHARQLRRAGKLWATWSDGCILKAKRTQQAPTTRLRSMADLAQFEQ